MADADAAADRKLKVFLSYSRKDEDFAQELLAGLQFAGFEPYLDKHDIAAGEDWEARLGRLIEAADTVVFIISPDAVASERCTWEVERTAALNKRLLPIVWRRVEDARVPPRLNQLNYIFFDKPLTFVASLKALTTALRTDVAWIREHTRIGELALRWDGRRRADALLLRGEELFAAKAWLSNPPQYAPEPTLLHHEFISASQDAELARTSAERQRLELVELAQEERQKAFELEKAAQALHEAALQKERLSISRIKRAQIWIGALLGCLVLGVAVGAWQLVERWRVLADREHIAARAKLAEGMIDRTGSLDQSVEQELTPGQTFKDCDNCPAMVMLPPGDFLMGSPLFEEDRASNELQRKVTIGRPFAVSKFEVTFAEWESCVTGGGCSSNREPSDGGWGRGTRPVINVTWNDARQYTEWLSVRTGKSYRLLSEAEWEYAARGIKEVSKPHPRFSWGHDLKPNAQAMANCGYCGSEPSKQTLPVGTFKPNHFGLYDMHGNVSEWVQDCDSVYAFAPTDGSAVETGNCWRVYRGGSWRSPEQDLRAARRRFAVPNSLEGLTDQVGFRVARVLPSARNN